MAVNLPAMHAATLPISSAINYERLLSALPGLYLVLSPQLIILEATEAYLQATLTKRNEIIGRYIFDVFPENPEAPEANAVENLRQSLLHVLSVRTPHTMPVQRYDIPRPAGLGGGFEERYWLHANNPVIGPEGDILYIVHQVTDVTMQQLAQREVHLNRERFDVLAQATNDAIWDWNLLSNDLWWSSGYETIFGYSTTDRSSNFDAWTQALHPDDYERVVNGVHNLLEQGGKMWADKFRFRRADGSYADVISRGYALRDEKGIVYRMIGSMLDITSQLHAERELEESRERFRSLLDALPNPAWTTNAEGTPTYFNQAWYKLTGMPAGQVSGVETYFHPEDLENLKQYWLQCRETCEAMEMEYRIKSHASGEYDWFLARAQPMRNTEGKVEQWLGTCTCITDQKKNQLELQAKENFIQRIIALGPVNLAVFKGPEHRCAYISPGFKKLQGNREILGRTVAEAWPEMAVQGFIAILDSVFTSGKPFYGEEFPVFADRYANGYMQEFFFDFSYQPLTDDLNKTIGVVATATDVTEQVYAKRAAEALTEKVHDANLRLEATLESLPLLTWVADPNGKATFFSRGWQELTGLSPNELKGDNWLELVHPDDVAETRNRWLQSLRTGQAFQIQFRLKTAASEFVRFQTRAVPIRNHKGIITQWTGVNTKLQEPQSVLIPQPETAQPLQTLIDNMAQLVWTALPDGTVDFLNQRWFEYTGLQPNDNAGENWQMAAHPEEIGLAMARWVQAVKTGEPFRMELRLADTRTGTYNWFLAQALPVRNPAGEIVKWVGTSTNIQAQKELLNELMGSKEQFEFLAESIPQLVWTTTPDGTHEYFNQRWVNYTGYTLQDSFGPKAWFELLHPEDRERAIARWQQALKTGEFYEIEYRFKRKEDGAYRWFLGQAMPMRNEAGEIVKWFGTCTDIEDHKRVEATILAKNEELLQINQNLDNFVYTASHDLKLPIMNMARIFEELTLEADFQDLEAGKLIGLFNKALQQIYGTINDLAEVVKVQKNLEESREPVNLRRLVEDITIGIQDLVSVSNATIKTDFSAAPEVWFSRASLKSVLYNLLTNSLKYASPHRHPQISLRTSPAGNYTLLTVSDNGLGIDLNKHGEKLFQMFKRFHKHVPGSGLGLYILNRIVTASGGHIQVESQVNQGTTFKIYFPNKALTLEKSSPELLNLVLLLNDDETANFLNERLLKRMAVAKQIKVVTDPEMALQYLQECSRNPDTAITPDLILTELKMAATDGFGFLNELESLKEKLPREPHLIMLTGDASAQDLEKLNQFAGVKKHFSKHLSELAVREIIRDLGLNRNL